MPSDCIVPVVEIKNVRIHPNADMLSLSEVLGYQMVNGLVEDPQGDIERCFVAGLRDERGRRIPANGDYEHLPEEIQEHCDVVEGVRYSFRYKDGQKVVYFPADTIIPDKWARAFDVKHLLQGPDQDRVGRCKLRGEPSFGLVVEIPKGLDWALGKNVADYYGATKYEPPPRNLPADCAVYDSEIDPHFVKYTDIQNGLLLYDKFDDDEWVVATEKIHGANCRIGIVNGKLVAGSRTTRKADLPGGEHYKDYLFWSPMENPGVESLLRAVEDAGAQSVILFGEVYGQGVQSLHYGVGGSKRKGFRAFDIYVDGEWLDFHGFADLCDQHGVERAPVLYQGPFDLEKIKEVSIGKSTLPGADNIREGVVVRAATERREPSLGRMVLKFISPQYDLSKHKKKDNTDV